MKTILKNMEVILFFQILILLPVIDITGNDDNGGNYTNGVWNIYTIDTNGDMGECTSITVDSNDKVHISYRDDSQNDLKYATNTSGVWQTFTIDTSDIKYEGRVTSITTDLDNKVHIAYYKGDLMYVTNKSGPWTIYAIDTEGWSGDYLSIAVNSSNKLYISYQGDTTDYYGFHHYQLKYATNASDSWMNYTIAEDGGETSIAIDSNDNLHISFEGSYFLKYITNKSGSWIEYTLDKAGKYLWATSIALDSNDKVHIGYYDCMEYGWSCSKGVLKYATNVNGEWETSTVDTLGVVGEFCSIGIDSNDKVHICYLDRTNNDLKYATNASDSWIITTIDDEGGWFCSLAIDSNDNVHISYHAGNSLKYATNTRESGIGQDINRTPEKFFLHENYPNPFNSVTKIEYQIPENSNVQIKIYNIHGEEVITLVNDFKEKGFHSVTWDASKFSSGIYIYKVIVGSYTESKKMLFLK